MLATKPRQERRFAFFPTLTLMILIGPVLAGLFGVVLPAFAIGDPAGANLVPWRSLAEWRGLGLSVWLSLKTGVLSTFGALCLAMLLTAGWQGTRVFTFVRGALSPLLSVPHVAAALGLAFVVAPSGWVARSFSPWATGWERPPDLLILQDSGGWALTFGLITKELPFLLLMILAALPQTQPEERLHLSRALGYGRVWGWCLAVWPDVYRQIRLPVYAVLAYGMSNVDVSLVLGPSTPPVLSMRILDAMTDPDLGLRSPAAAAALLQLVLVAAALMLWRSGEALAAAGLRWWLWHGARGAGIGDHIIRRAGLGLAGLAVLGVFSGLFAHMVWSVAGRWRFPDALPETLKLGTWSRALPAIWEVSLLTLGLAAVVTALALCLVLGCLETEQRGGRRMGQGGLFLLYLPLIIPQITFIPGLQVLFLSLVIDRGIAPVILAHLVFVLPYVFLSLSGPYRSWDRRIGTVAAALGASKSRIFWRLRLPMMFAPILTAAAVGVAVSVGQYLPTLLMSGGRVSTLATEALALSSGGNRRVIGAWGLALTLIAWAPFLLALLLPRVAFRNRKGMNIG